MNTPSLASSYQAGRGLESRLGQSGEYLDRVRPEAEGYCLLSSEDQPEVKTNTRHNPLIPSASLSQLTCLFSSEAVIQPGQHLLIQYKSRGSYDTQQYLD